MRFEERDGSWRYYVDADDVCAWLRARGHDELADHIAAAVLDAGASNDPWGGAPA